MRNVRSALVVDRMSRYNHKAQQGIHRHQTPPRYRNPVNVTSSIKPEAHNVAQRCQSRTEQRQQGICVKNFVKIDPVVPEICSLTDKQTRTQTDGLITILGTPTGAE